MITMRVVKKATKMRIITGRFFICEEHTFFLVISAQYKVIN